MESFDVLLQQLDEGNTIDVPVSRANAFMDFIKENPDVRRLDILTHPQMDTYRIKLIPIE